MLEIYAFARDAFKGGQKTIQLQALPFRMTAENMARHRLSPNIDFWKMLKVGYDNFEVTKRPPEVERLREEIRLQPAGRRHASMPAGKCPTMSTPPALQSALVAYNKTYDARLRQGDEEIRRHGLVRSDRSRAQGDRRQAARNGHELAYAPTGSSLAAGKLMKVTELETLMAKPVQPADDVSDLDGRNAVRHPHGQRQHRATAADDASVADGGQPPRHRLCPDSRCRAASAGDRAGTGAEPTGLCAGPEPAVETAQDQPSDKNAVLEILGEE